MTLAQNLNQRVLHLVAAVPATAIGEQFGTLAVKVTLGGAGAVEPHRVDRFSLRLAGQIGGRDLGPDLGNCVVEFDQAALLT